MDKLFFNLKEMAIYKGNVRVMKVENGFDHLALEIVNIYNSISNETK